MDSFMHLGIFVGGFFFFFFQKVLYSRWSSNQMVSRSFCSLFLNFRYRMSCVCPLVFYPCKLKITENLGHFPLITVILGSSPPQRASPTLTVRFGPVRILSVPILSWWELKLWTVKYQKWVLVRTTLFLVFLSLSTVVKSAECVLTVTRSKTKFLSPAYFW